MAGRVSARRLAPHMSLSPGCFRRPLTSASLGGADSSVPQSGPLGISARPDARRGLVGLASMPSPLSQYSRIGDGNVLGSFRTASFAVFAGAFLLSQVKCEADVDENASRNVNVSVDEGDFSAFTRDDSHNSTNNGASSKQVESNEVLQGSTREVHVQLPTDKLSCQRVHSNPSRRKEQVVLLSAGSFNPPTFMHLRMLELARETLLNEGYDVIGAYISPVNGAYKKAGLVASEHRVQMCQLAAQDSPFIMVDTWESKQLSYQPTLFVLQRFDTALNPPLTPDNEKVRPVLVCGADLLESFGVPGVWQPEQVKKILSNYGIVCITRGGSNARKFIQDNDLLYEHRKRVVIVDEWITNDISATKLRQNISRGLSIKYLTPDSVISYINNHSLYQRDRVG